jgi:hypothetical protein
VLQPEIQVGVSGVHNRSANKRGTDFEKLQPFILKLKTEVNQFVSMQLLPHLD